MIYPGLIFNALFSPSTNDAVRDRIGQAIGPYDDILKASYAFDVVKNSFK